ncbi:class F sortase [Rhodococcus sp. SGAir0479]|uniref:class F sortase n=1 Tax=Rhodococcus sp. SGAir0479 TaxID=2567884 RepID=UPI0020C78745|nr:class F sortase [Rhodococcus sp. SGAir0479]
MTAAALTVTGCAATESDNQAAPATPVTSVVTPALPSGAVRPDRLVIPAIDVDTDLMDLGLDQAGALQVPPAGFPAGWYSGSPAPGELGPAVVAGHVDWDRKPGVFYRLAELAPGDEVVAERSDGGEAEFRVTRVERYEKSAFPTAAVYGDIDHPGLRLITCGGEFDTDVRSYRDNVVVFADLTELRKASPPQEN